MMELHKEYNGEFRLRRVKVLIILIAGQRFTVPALSPWPWVIFCLPITGVFSLNALIVISTSDAELLSVLPTFSFSIFVAL